MVSIIESLEQVIEENKRAGSLHGYTMRVSPPERFHDGRCTSEPAKKAILINGKRTGQRIQVWFRDVKGDFAKRWCSINSVSALTSAWLSSYDRGNQTLIARHLEFQLPQNEKLSRFST